IRVSGSDAVFRVGVNQTARLIAGRIGRLYRPGIPVSGGLAILAEIEIKVDALVRRVAELNVSSVLVVGRRCTGDQFSERHFEITVGFRVRQRLWRPLRKRSGHRIGEDKFSAGNGTSIRPDAQDRFLVPTWKCAQHVALKPYAGFYK